MVLSLCNGTYIYKLSISRNVNLLRCCTCFLAKFIHLKKNFLMCEVKLHEVGIIIAKSKLLIFFTPSILRQPEKLVLII